MNKKTKSIDLSIVIPAYNEETLLQDVVEEALKDAPKLLKKFEIVIVDDGSSDTTGSVARKLQAKHKNVCMVSHSTNLGLGRAILSGIQKAKYSYVTFLPADGQLYLRDFAEALDKIPHADLVLTYREKKHDYSLYRHSLSQTLKIFMKIFFGLSFRDYNWAHIYKKDIFTHIRPKSKGVFFLGEVVARAHKQGYKIVEAKSLYRPRSGGKSKNTKLKVVFATVRDLLRVWVALHFYE